MEGAEYPNHPNHKFYLDGLKELETKRELTVGDPNHELLLQGWDEGYGGYINAIDDEWYAAGYESGLRARRYDKDLLEGE